jgi:formylglycine-generating enzyme required for sulfatase activity
MMSKAKNTRYPLPYRLDDGREELGGGDDIWRVIKGGSYFDDKSDWPRCAFRFGSHPYFRHYHIGFRVVVSPLPTSGL